MKLMVAILVVLSACKARVVQWDGIPADIVNVETVCPAKP
jgi:hypothetical protein